MKKLIALTLSLAPVGVFAAEITNFDGLTSKFTNIGNTVVVILTSFSVIWIIISVVRYLIAGGDPEARTKGGWAVFYGIVGLFIILSIWGLVAILKNTFGTNNNIPRDQFPKVIPPPGVN